MRSTIIIPTAAAKKATRGNIIIIPTAARRAAAIAAAPAPTAPAAPAPVSARPVIISHYDLTGGAREVYRHLYRAGIAGKVAQIAAEKIGSEPAPERLQLFLCRPRLWAEALHIDFNALMSGNYAAARAGMLEA